MTPRNHRRTQIVWLMNPTKKSKSAKKSLCNCSAKLWSMPIYSPNKNQFRKLSAERVRSCSFGKHAIVRPGMFGGNTEDLPVAVVVHDPISDAANS